MQTNITHTEDFTTINVNFVAESIEEYKKLKGVFNYTDLKDFLKLKGPNEEIKTQLRAIEEKSKRCKTLISLLEKINWKTIIEGEINAN